MCGIFGFIKKTANKNNDQETLEKMSGLLKHRGPDAFGFFVDAEKGIYLGHRRLSIIDLSVSGQQPMANEDGNLQIIFNGEIFNFKDIKEGLVKKGHYFQSKTDTEVILHLYEEEGLGCLSELNGMFAFALLDKKNDKLILARDRIGIKPLYYYNDDRVFSWASETKALKALGRLELNENSIRKLLGFQYLPDNKETTIKNVCKVPPGHFIIYDLNKKTQEIKSYWSLKINEEIRKLSFRDAKERLENLLVDSVKLRLVADVDIGIMLSGGLDSSIIAALAQKYSNKKAHTFTAGFRNKIDERSYARKVSGHIGSNHVEIMIKTEEVASNIEKFINYFDDLNTFDGGLLTNFLIAEKMRERGIKAILLGEGSDEIFGGYSWFGISKLPFSLLPNIIKKYLYYYSTSRNLSFKPLLYFRQINEKFNQLSGSAQNFFDSISAYEISYQLPNHYLMKVDKGTMAQSVEARVPYLDYRIVEFAYSLNSQFKLKGGWHSFRRINEKYILREIAKEYLPEEIAMRKKQGGMLSIAEVIKSNMPKIKEYLLDEKSLSSQIFGRKKIEELFNKKPDSIGKSNWHFREVEREMFLWKLFILEVWNKTYFK